MGYEAREPPGVAPGGASSADRGNARRSDDPALDRWLSDGLGSPLCLRLRPALRRTLMMRRSF